MLRVLAVLLAALLLGSTTTVAAPTVKSYSTLTTEQFQQIADAVLAIPQVASSLSDGDKIRFLVQDYGSRPAALKLVTVESYEGTLSGGKAAIAKVAGGSGKAALELAASRSFWGALVNACDTANTAKMGIRDGYVGIDGGSAAKAAANGAKTGRFDAQLQVTRVAEGVAFPCMGEAPVLRKETGGTTSYSGRPFFPKTYMLGDIQGRTYVINHLGAIEAQLPSAYVRKAVHATVSWEEEDAVSWGSVSVPDECKTGANARGLWASYFTALCLKERGVSS